METNNRLHVRVALKHELAQGVAGFELVSASGVRLPAFDAGAHIDVHTPAGAIRQYSLHDADAPDGRYRIAVLRDAAGRGGSASMHDGLAQGDSLLIGMPRNHFRLHEGAARSLLFAGGIGITPIIAMARRLHTLGAPFELHYRTRSAQQAAFASALQHGPLAAHSTLYHDDADQSPELERILGGAGGQDHLYVCGPKGFMDAVIAAARAQGWGDEQIHVEYFVAPVPAPVDSGSFEIELASSGQVVAVSSGQTIVEALALCGVDIPTSCKHGICGTCLTGVISGEIEHHDFYLTPQEHERQDLILACCSRARSKRIVLDL